VRVCVRARVRACQCACMCMHMCLHTWTLTQSLSDKHGDRPDAKLPLINLCTRTHAHTCKHTHTHTHTHTNTHTHKHTHTHTQPELVLLTALCENGSIFDFYTQKLMPSRRRFDLKTAFRLSIEIAKVCVRGMHIGVCAREFVFLHTRVCNLLLCFTDVTHFT